MKTPEEIKKGLECCGNSGNCKGCPYDGGYELCMGTLAEDALAYVQQLEQRLVEVNKTSPRWISVKDRLPENSLRALVRVIHRYNHTDGYAEIAMSYFVNGRWEDIPPKYYDVTHWMPLPELPEDDYTNDQAQQGKEKKKCCD